MYPYHAVYGLLLYPQRDIMIIYNFLEVLSDFLLREFTVIYVSQSLLDKFIVCLVAFYTMLWLFIYYAVAYLVDHWTNIVITWKHTHTRLTAVLSGTIWVSLYQKGKTNLDFTEARDSEWQWHKLDHMQVCTALQTDNHASTPPLSFLQARCPSCHQTNSVKALKAI